MTSDEAEARKAFHQLVNGPELRLMSAEDLWLASWSAARKDVDELLDCLTRAMEELGIAYLVTEQAPEDQRAIMNCLMKHGRVVIDGGRYRWKEEEGK